ncbi:MAG: glycogen synthase GlgA [Clostridia bacterium]|nr:glycogen synthase GlgA [Clostridia bacterium]
MKILYASSEALPFASTGGLGDVIGSLPPAVKALLGDGGDVRVVIPMFPTVKEKFSDVLKLEKEIFVPLSWRRQYCGIWSTERDGVIFYFLDNEYYFKRSGFYGSYDDGERFAFFGKAVLEMMAALDFYPDILHANDWQSSLAVIYLKTKYYYLPEYSGIKTIYTIHNIEYQGIYDFAILGDVFDLTESERDIVEYNGAINLSKGAITISDEVTTVSERYASEIMTPYYSHGLSEILNRCGDKLCGIVNGIDTAYYDPRTDKSIKYHYSETSLAGKSKDKAILQTMCGFDVDHDTPLVAMVSRLASHKGFDLVCRVIEEILIYDRIQFVLLGTGDSVFEEYFKRMNDKYTKKFCAFIEFNKDLSKQIYAGADMFLMPSKSEPCGLSQMIASRYGTVPIVRETGGLFDTIKAYNRYDGTGNGFSFANYNAHEMMEVIRQAEELFCNRRAWNRLVRRVMTVDFSWGVSAGKYISLYKSLI